MKKTIILLSSILLIITTLYSKQADKKETTTTSFLNYISTPLKELIDSDEFALMVENFKRDYKRRKNFVAILNKRF